KNDPRSGVMAEVDSQIAELLHRSTHELRLAWRRLHRVEPPQGLSRDLLIRALAHQLQEQSYAGTGRAFRRRLQTSVLPATSSAFSDKPDGAIRPPACAKRAQAPLTVATPRLAFPPDNHVVRFRAWVQDCQIFWTRPLIAWSCQTQNRQFQTEENMANSSTKSAKTKVIHAGFLLADPDIQPKSDQSILIEGERIKAVSDGFIDPPPGG